jgi:HSP20 family molecular chaperone IbpA
MLERGNGKVERTFRLPNDADATRINATFDMGVLSISIPKTYASVGPVVIPIRFC